MKNYRYNTINKDKMIEYMLANEKARYEAIKAITKCVKHICIALIVSLALVACCYMYFVVPVEEDTITADNGSQVISSSTIGGNNGL